MNVRTKLFGLLTIIMVLSMALAACQPTVVKETVQVTVPPEKIVETQKVIETQKVVETQVVTVKETIVVEVTAVPPTPEPSKRKGAWVDSVVFTEQNSAQAAVKQLQAGDLDVYAYTVSDTALFKEVSGDPKLSYTTSFGSYNELTFNPAGPVLNNKKLNPFASPKVREAMNWLVDRNYIKQELFGGLGSTKTTTLNANFPDYARYIDVVRAIEAKYAYNMDKAKEAITAEMTAMGATLVDNKWTYENEPVTLIFLIRVEDARRQIGDYVATKLEEVGFTVDRAYKTRSEASPLWNSSDPMDGKWHLYTGGWITTAISRDDATNFGYFYTNLGSGSPLWQAYKNDPAYHNAENTGVADKLWVNNFKSMDERRELFTQALNLSMEDSNRVWLIDQQSYAPQVANVSVAYDLAGGVAGSQLWPLTIRFNDQEGGTMRIAQPGILVEPWNPIAGSNWIYDSMPIRATNDAGVMADPYTGLNWPQRIEKADMTVKTGLPVAKTLDWLTLTTADNIEVPADAWTDWDAKAGKFITVGEKYTSTQTANVKVVVTYPADLWTTVKWHDGSALSIGDFVMGMILTFDRGKADSAIYDESAVPALEAYQSHFKGVKIVSTDPLVIETYDDTFYLDAEWGVTSWWPAYGFGPGAWHNLAIGIMADAEKDPKKALAFSTDKAGAREVEWMSYISGPSLAILRANLDTAITDNYLPYAETLGQFVKPEEITARYANLLDFYKLQGHFWIGTGPFYVNKAFPIEKTLTINRFDQYVDPAVKWSGFGVPPIATVEITGDAKVTIGKEAKFTVNVTLDGKPYANADIDSVKFLLFDAKGNLAVSGPAVAGEDGVWTVTLSADDTKKLEAGSNKLEVAVVSKLVSIPALVSFQFVTAP